MSPEPMARLLRHKQINEFVFRQVGENFQIHRIPESSPLLLSLNDYRLTPVGLVAWLSM